MVRQDRISLFNERHGVDEDSQFKQLSEEVGELAEAINRDAGDDAIAEELADVIFVARSIAEIRDINIGTVVNDVVKENLLKSQETDGDKVTKSTDGGVESQLDDDGKPLAPYPKCDDCGEYHRPSYECDGEGLTTPSKRRAKEKGEETTHVPTELGECQWWGDNV